MLKSITKVQLAYYVQLLEHPEVLVSRYYHIQSYKQGLGEIVEQLLNTFVGELNNHQFRDIVAFTYYYWKIENEREESDLELLPLFVKILRKDVANRAKFEMDLRAEV